MNQQYSRLALRILVVASVFFAFVGMIISLAGDGFLPKELADWKAAQENDDEGAMLVGLLLISPLLIALAASIVGLFLYQKWAAWLFLAITVLCTMMMLLEPMVESGISAFFTDLDTTLGGVILGIAFFSDALESDRHS
jgi:small-conductance mechanosensitive channel